MKYFYIFIIVCCPGTQPLPQHPGGIWSGPSGIPPHQEILGQNHHGGADRRILWHHFQGILRGDPGGPSISHNLQCGSRFVPPTLGHHGKIDGGGSRPWNGGNGGFRVGCPTSRSILLCGRWNTSFESSGMPTVIFHNPAGAL